MVARASAFSFQSLGMYFSFQVEKLPKSCLIRVTYLAIRGSQESYSAFTCPTTNWESLQIISLPANIAATSSISTRMPSFLRLTHGNSYPIQ